MVWYELSSKGNAMSCVQLAGILLDHDTFDRKVFILMANLY